VAITETGLLSLLCLINKELVEKCYKVFTKLTLVLAALFCLLKVREQEQKSTSGIDVMVFVTTFHKRVRKAVVVTLRFPA
jgi:hypothetical protein